MKKHLLNDKKQSNSLISKSNVEIGTVKEYYIDKKQ